MQLERIGSLILIVTCSLAFYAEFVGGSGDFLDKIDGFIALGVISGATLIGYGSWQKGKQ